MIRQRTLPGVEVREISTIPPAIAPVSTAIPAFIGFTEKQTGEMFDGINGQGDIYVRRITSFTEFEEAFGGAFDEKITVTVKDTLAVMDAVDPMNPPVITTDVTARTVEIKRNSDGTIEGTLNGGINPVSNLYYSLQSFFANGGADCYIISIGVLPDAFNTTGTQIRPPVGQFNRALEVLSEFDEPTLIVSPDASTHLSATNQQSFIQQALMNASSLQDRFVVADVNADIETVNGPTDEMLDNPSSVIGFTSNVSAVPEVARYGSLYFPFLETTLPLSFGSDTVTIEHQFFAANDPTRELLDEMDIPEGVDNYDGVLLSVVQSGREEDPSATPEPISALPASPALSAVISGVLAGETVNIPPSGPVAGVYAFTDLNRGVFRAPANVPLAGVIQPSVLLTDLEHSQLNVPESGNGRAVNAIRSFTGRGNLVFGARTLDGNSNEWRYINVRRLFIFLEESIQNAMESFVFEPNTGQTWLQIRGTIENFLTNQWRIGAIAGAQPADAFFVRVGLGETMTADDINNGILNVEIGIAPARPAEFIVLQFSQTQQLS